MHYLDIRLNGKYYVQRTEFNKIIEFDEKNKRNRSYDSITELPKEVKIEIENILEMRNNPLRYFECHVNNNGTYNISFTNNELDIKNLFIPAYIGGIKVTKFSNLDCITRNKIERLILPDTITEIGEGLCAGNSTLREVILSKNIKKISNNAFVNCKKLEKINLENVENLGTNSFYNCESLIELNLDKLAILGPNSLRNCINIIQLNLPNIKGIYNNALSDNDNLQTVNFGTNLIYMGIEIFRNCISLDNVYIPEGIIDIKDGMFENCKKLNTIHIPNTVTKIGTAAFSLTNLSGVFKIPLNVKVIDEYAFTGCDFEAINIPHDTTFKKTSFSIEKERIKVYNKDIEIDER